MKPPTTLSHCTLLLALFLTTTLSQLQPDQDPTKDYYCGINWNEANAYCSLPCPSGSNGECPPAETGRARYCFAAADCFVRKVAMYWTGIVSLEFDQEKHLADGKGGVLMSETDIAALERSMMSFLGDGFSGEMEITCASVQDQEYDRPCVDAVIPGRRLFGSTDSSVSIENYELELGYQSHQIFFRDTTTDATSMQQSIRKLARDESITALDLTVQICAQYIPALDATTKVSESDLQNNIISIIANNEQGAVNAISSSSTFFNALTGITALSTDMLLDPPSSSPSVSPTRSDYQTIETFIDAKPSGSYGIFFSIRTKAQVSTILLTEMAFVTPHNGTVEYEVYSRLGDFRGHEGFETEWDLIARGQTVASGPGAFTRVLNEVPEDYDSSYVGFSSIHVPGNLGIRSFYITMTKTFSMTDGDPVPLSFSDSSVPENEGTSNYAVIVSNEELEILEGDAVLEFPAPQNRDGTSEYYKRPRGFLGSFQYTREACFPAVDFFGWPCPVIPKNRLPTKLPTKKPVSSTTLQIASSSSLPTMSLSKNGTDASTSSARESMNDLKVATNGEANLAAERRGVYFFIMLIFCMIQ
eukprot:CCRYP_015442-RA/>CCRYP_015442-RA protein AED:0.37 eAED:0.37 QI:114/1/1/1/1/1/3/225/586